MKTFPPLTFKSRGELFKIEQITSRYDWALFTDGRGISIEMPREALGVMYRYLMACHDVDYFTGVYGIKAELEPPPEKLEEPK